MITYDVEIAKASPKGSYVRGWASVAVENGAPVLDYDGHVIPMSELVNAAHAFIQDHRVAKMMHDGQAVGEVVESVIVDDEFAKALGVSDGKRGWWIGMKINDETVRKQVVSGKLKAFSIGGKGRVIEV